MFIHEFSFSRGIVKWFRIFILHLQAKFCEYEKSENGIAQWLERRTRDWKVAGSNPCRSGGRIFFSMVNFLCWLLFRYPFHSRVTAVARKRSRSFCQKCRWQVTAKHAYTLPMWLWMKWHLVHGWMVCTELAPKWQHFTWHQPIKQPQSATNTPLPWILIIRAIKRKKKKRYSHSFRITC